MAGATTRDLVKALKEAQLELFPVAPRQAGPDCEALLKRATLRKDEAAAVLSCSSDQVEALVACGRLHAIWIGDDPAAQRKHMRIVVASIKSVLEGKT